MYNNIKELQREIKELGLVGELEHDELMFRSKLSYEAIDHLGWISGVVYSHLDIVGDGFYFNRVGRSELDAVGLKAIIVKGNEAIRVDVTDKTYVLCRF